VVKHTHQKKQKKKDDTIIMIIIDHQWRRFEATT
jgi:hypothetical protein